MTEMTEAVNIYQWNVYGHHSWHYDDVVVGNLPLGKFSGPQRPKTQDSKKKKKS